MTPLPPSHDDFAIVPAVDGRGLAIRHRVTVEWGDCDPAGIIFYPTYFRWWDQGSWRLFRAIGLDRRAMREDLGGVDIPILEAAGAFQATVTPGDALVVSSIVERWGNSSFRVSHAVARLDGSPVASGHETRCWTKALAGQPGKLKATRIPDDIVARFGGTRATSSA
ncbi:MAG: acyl-CoA thioesterase [Alphaproteobacteria bacterium]|nr:acyl-CoA thioesterase [Alphaproteobacteria bacterium]MCW5743481.1 acyl-CoA thioesterase [Alphaproteobacteria bacterium]